MQVFVNYFKVQFCNSLFTLPTLTRQSCLCLVCSCVHTADADSYLVCVGGVKTHLRIYWKTLKSFPFESSRFSSGGGVQQSETPDVFVQ